jgi:hypothetical protein
MDERIELNSDLNKRHDNGYKIVVVILIYNRHKLIDLIRVIGQTVTALRQKL